MDRPLVPLTLLTVYTLVLTSPVEVPEIFVNGPGRGGPADRPAPLPGLPAGEGVVARRLTAADGHGRGATARVCPGMPGEGRPVGTATGRLKEPGDDHRTRHPHGQPAIG
jgi:hypothetical protein